MSEHRQRKNKRGSIPTLVIIKSMWLTLDGQPGRDYQMVALKPGQDAGQVREQALAHLRSHGYTDCFVDIFDPDHVPPGAIPDDITLSVSGLDLDADDL